MFCNLRLLLLLSFFYTYLLFYLYHPVLVGFDTPSILGIRHRIIIRKLYPTGCRLLPLPLFSYTHWLFPVSAVTVVELLFYL